MGLYPILHGTTKIDTTPLGRSTPTNWLKTTKLMWLVTKGLHCMTYAVVMMRRSWRNSGQICPIAHGASTSAVRRSIGAKVPFDASCNSVVAFAPWFVFLSPYPPSYQKGLFGTINFCEVAAIEYARLFWIDSSIGLVELSLNEKSEPKCMFSENPPCNPALCTFFLGPKMEVKNQPSTF